MKAAGGIWHRLAREVTEDGRAGEPGGLWEDLRGRLDVEEFRPRLAADVELKEFVHRWGGRYAMLANPRDLVHFRLEPGEIELVRLMDGTRSVKEIVLERFKESGDLELEGVADLVRQLQEGGFLDPPYIDVYGTIGARLDPSVARAKTRQFLRTLSVEWRGADRFVRRLHRRLRWVFRPSVLIAAGLVGAAGVAAFVAVFRSGRFSLAGDALALEFLILFALNYFTTFVHELGHALVVVHHGRKVKSAGFQIYYGSPAFFVDVSDALMLDRPQRVAQAAAGPIGDFVLAGGASLFILAFPDALISSTLYKFAILNYFILFMNLIPLLELDGYYILADLIQIPDLRPRSLAFLRHDLLHRIRKRERFSAQDAGLTLYGTLGVAFAAFSLYSGYFFWREITGRTISRMWNGGQLTRTLLVILLLLVAGPLVRGFLGLLRALLARARGLWRDVRFRLERSWRVEAAEMIDNLATFRDLPEEVLSELAGRVRLRRVAPGQPVVRQGERADAFYVVRRGTLQTVEEDPGQRTERVLRTLGRGESFGELGLLQAAARAATVRAATEAEVFEIDKGTFDQLLADTAEVPHFAPTLQAVAEVRALPPFSHLEPEGAAELLEHGEWANIAPGQEVLRQGQVGDAFYAVQSGQVEVVGDGKRVAVLGPGSYFGEVALLLDVPRTATVRAMTPVRAYRLDREGFDRLVRQAFRRGTLNPQAVVDRALRH
jgi:CRP-like cAMP-binding protein/Zn-dependent protease